MTFESANDSHFTHLGSDSRSGMARNSASSPALFDTASRKEIDSDTSTSEHAGSDRGAADPDRSVGPVLAGPVPVVAQADVPVVAQSPVSVVAQTPRATSGTPRKTKPRASSGTKRAKSSGATVTPPAIPGHEWRRSGSGWVLWRRVPTVTQTGKRGSARSYFAFYSNAAIRRIYGEK